MEESDDGGLEAVVRAGRGYHNIKNNNNNTVNNSSCNWQSPQVLGIDAGSIGNAGVEEGQVVAGMNPMGQGDSNSEMNIFANLLRTSMAYTRPPAMDLQELCSPFFNGNLLRSSNSASSKLLFENIEVQKSSSIFAADSPPASKFAEKKAGDPIKVEPEIEFGKLTGLKSVEAMSPAAGLSSLASEPSVAISKPLKVESSSIKEGDGSSLSTQVRTDLGMENGSSSQTTGSGARGQGSKRPRKAQLKKVMYVPAAGGSNRPSGDGIHPDLWAWRKYGQKPIKGSPYPRGYYRCSSSKGCLARKQVERSRSDPSILVITYTSEHNHPWPTHRNALAGSTRQAEKVITSEKENSDQMPENSGVPESKNTKDTPFSAVTDASEATAIEALQQVGAAGSNSSVQAPDSAVPQNDPAAINNLLTDAHHHDEDFFAELGELPESLNVFPRQFDDDKSDDEAASSVLDPFNLFTWA